MYYTSLDVYKINVLLNKVLSPIDESFNLYYTTPVRINFLSSSGVERPTVNRFVVGSNPTWGV